MEASRAGAAGFNRSLPVASPSSSFVASGAGDAESVIDERLLTFNSVSELQQKNIELLAVVRELSQNQEGAEARIVEEKTQELRKELEMATEQVEELRQARQRQEAMVESIIVERDMYKARVDAAARYEKI